jgi:hypothetical protein
MGYKDHYSNPDIRLRRMIVLPNYESHDMGYKDHSSNPNIRPRRILVLLDDESHAMGYNTLLIRTYVLEYCPGPPSGHYCELRENVCLVPISPLLVTTVNSGEPYHSSNPDICPRRIVVLDHST